MDGPFDLRETSCTYTPNPDYHGTDTSTYTVSDRVDTATANVTVTVDRVNDARVAVGDEYAAVEDIALEVAAVDGCSPTTPTSTATRWPPPRSPNPPTAR